MHHHQKDPGRSANERAYKNRSMGSVPEAREPCARAQLCLFLNFNKFLTLLYAAIAIVVVVAGAFCLRCISFSSGRNNPLLHVRTIL